MSQLYKKNNLRSYAKLVSTCLCLLFSIGIHAESNKQSEESSHQRYFEYQQAAQYTNLKWRNSLRPPVTLNILPIKNFSGIPMEARNESADYFYHGKLPLAMNQIAADAFNASRLFKVTQHPAEYQIELILDEYKLPFKYSADDKWWQTLHDQADRWLQTASATQVKLTLVIRSAQRPIRAYMDSVEMVLSNCDLNATPQPATMATNRDVLRNAYLSTTPGQSFLAATNFLILRAIERLNQEPQLARVESKFGNEISLVSDTAEFVSGQIVEVFFNHENSQSLIETAGQMKVIKSHGKRAIAYPLNLLADNIIPGDKVTLENPSPFEKPQSIFVAANQCAAVYTAEVEIEGLSNTEQ